MKTIVKPHDRFGTPWDFKVSIEVDGCKVEYHNLGELCMGCPIAGTIAVNDRAIDNYLFGGPFIKFSSYIYIPVYGRDEYIGRSFALYKLNINTLRLQQISNPHSLVILDRIEDERVYFYKNMDKQVITSVGT